MKKNTDELNHILGKTTIADFDSYLSENKEEIITNEKQFEVFFKNLIADKKLQLKEVFVRADIPEKYGYKLLSGEKKTRQRDVMLRLFYAAELNFNETQHALKLYGMPELYPRVERDALIITCINTRPGGIIEVNESLQSYGMIPLRSTGMQE